MFNIIRSFTRLARPIDLTYRTNQYIVAVSLVFSVIGYFVTDSTSEALRWIWVPFLSWAIARELDPDREWIAFVSVIFAIFSTAFWGIPSFIIPAFLLLMLRIVVRTVSSTVLMTDGIGLGMFFAWIGYDLARAGVTLPPQPEVVIVGLVVLVFLLKTIRIRKLEARTDMEQDLLRVSRLKQGRILALVLTVVLMCFKGHVSEGMYLTVIMFGLLMG